MNGKRFIFFKPNFIISAFMSAILIIEPAVLMANTQSEVQQSVTKVHDMAKQIQDVAIGIVEKYQSQGWRIDNKDATRVVIKAPDEAKVPFAFILQPVKRQIQIASSDLKNIYSTRQFNLNGNNSPIQNLKLMSRLLSSEVNNAAFKSILSEGDKAIPVGLRDWLGENCQSLLIYGGLTILMVSLLGLYVATSYFVYEAGGVAALGGGSLIQDLSVVLTPLLSILGIFGGMKYGGEGLDKLSKYLCGKET